MAVNDLTADELYEAGARAFAAGRALWACPVATADSHDAKRWQAGYRDAQEGRYVANAGADIPRVRVARQGRKAGTRTPFKRQCEGL